MAYNKKKSEGPDVFFVNYDLRKDEKQALKRLMDDEPEKIFDMAEKAVDGSYSITLKRDEYNECIGCYMRSLVEDSHNAGLILTGRGKTAFSALAGALFRHDVLFQGEWPRHQDKKGETDDLD